MRAREAEVAATILEERALAAVAVAKEQAVLLAKEQAALLAKEQAATIAKARSAAIEVAVVDVAVLGKEAAAKILFEPATKEIPVARVPSVTPKYTSFADRVARLHDEAVAKEEAAVANSSTILVSAASLATLVAPTLAASFSSPADSIPLVTKADAAGLEKVCVPSTPHHVAGTPPSPRCRHSTASPLKKKINVSS